MEKHTITAFAHHRVKRLVEFPRTTNYARDRDRIIDRIVETLAAARWKRFHRHTPDSDRESTVAHIEKLVKEMGKPHPTLRILEVVCWYEEHCEEEFIPWIEGGPSLYKKFSRLEAHMLERTKQDRAPTVDEVVAGLFNGSRELSNAFRSDILVCARRLNIGNVLDGNLAAKLGEVYTAIRAARNGQPVPGIPGPLELLHRYVDWLSEKDWIMTTRVLDVASPAFQQFCREEASRHPRGVDPLTGRN